MFEYKKKKKKKKKHENKYFKNKQNIISNRITLKNTNFSIAITKPKRKITLIEIVRRKTLK